MCTQATVGIDEQLTLTIINPRQDRRWIITGEWALFPLMRAFQRLFWFPAWHFIFNIYILSFDRAATQDHQPARLTGRHTQHAKLWAKASSTDGCITAFQWSGFNEGNPSFLLNKRAGPVKETCTSPSSSHYNRAGLPGRAVAGVHFFNLSIRANASILHISTGKHQKSQRMMRPCEEK